MRTELSCDFSNPLQVLDNLKSRYPCVHVPLPLDATEAVDDQRYLTPLCVIEDREENEPDSPLPRSFSNFMDDQNIVDSCTIKEKIASALKDLKFREEHVLVQFWSPVVVKRRSLLMTLDQPFGIGALDEKLYSYRKQSERYAIVVDAEQSEKLDSQGRVYCEKKPEWSLDVRSKYSTCYNIHGYINLPVFDESSSDYCVGVLEIITSSMYVDFAFEVQEVSRALKNHNLKSTNMFDYPSLSVSDVSSDLISLSPSLSALQIADNSRQHDHEILDQIFNVLKTVCDIHNLPLAQTWGPSAYSSYVSTSGNLEQSCGSFNKSCIGKACMSTTGLPFYIRDLSKWDFHEACKERHLDKSRGVVGKSLSSCGTWFCKDLTELGEEDYPLVHHARMSRLSSCLAIYLKNTLESVVEFVVEFFLPTNSTNEIELRRLMKTVNQQIENSSWKEIDISSPPQVIGEVSLNWIFESSPSPINLSTEKGEVPVLLLEPPLESENFEIEPSNSAAAAEETSQSVVPYLESAIDNVSINPIKLKRKRKRQERSITLEEISRHFGKTMDEAAAILKVSRSTLKRICRNLGVPRWPYKNGPESDALKKLDNKEATVHKSEGSLTPTSVFGASNEPRAGTTYMNHDTNAVTENGKHNTSKVSRFQHELNLLDEDVQPETTVKEKVSEASDNVTIKATYSKNIVKFTYHLSDGLERLNELVAERFQLKIGSFRLKYFDEDGDLILIACENDLTWSLGTFRQPESQTVIKLFVELVFPHS